jgi:hypothetical protein
MIATHSSRSAETTASNPHLENRNANTAALANRPRHKINNQHAHPCITIRRSADAAHTRGPQLISNPTRFDLERGYLPC